jgi:N-methylhydantoinase B
MTALRTAPRDPSFTLDPVTFEVIRHRLWAINDEQAQMTARLSGSPVIYEVLDFNAAITTADGRGLFCGMYIIAHASTIDHMIREILGRWSLADIHEGDMFFTNDPWSGALHPNDGILVSPIFWEGDIVAWSGIAMHDDDVGGPVPGGFSPGAHNGYEEPPLIPVVKLVEGYHTRPDLERWYLRNSRTPEFNALNMRARLASLSVANQRVHALIGQYGVDAFVACQQEVLAYTERVVRKRLREIPDGTWFSEGYLDHDGVEDRVYPIRCTLQKTGDRLVVDFAGTAPQAGGGINCAAPGAEGAVYGAMMVSLFADVPWSAGAARELVEIHQEPGTVNHAQPPAAVSMASVSGVLCTGDVVGAAIAKMLLCSPQHRDTVQANWSAGINAIAMTGFDAEGHQWVQGMMDCMGGGGGAGLRADGIDTGSMISSLGVTVPNVETTESRIPVLMLYRREATDSGGVGRQRGGAGVEYAATPHKSAGPIFGATLSSQIDQPGGAGLSGGGPAACASNIVVRGTDVAQLLAAGSVPKAMEELTGTETDIVPAKAQVMIESGDVFFSAIGGGSAIGDPLRRDPGHVLADVREGLVSAAAGHDLYGVVIDGSGELDAAATAERRDALRRARRAAGGAGERSGDRGAINGAPDSTEHLHPVIDTVEAVAQGDERWLRCTECRTRLAPYDGEYKADAVMRERTITELSDRNRHSPLVDQFVVREYACPGCGTALAIDLQLRDEEHLRADVRLAPHREEIPA